MSSGCLIVKLHTIVILILKLNFGTNKKLMFTIQLHFVFQISLEKGWTLKCHSVYYVLELCFCVFNSFLSVLTATKGTREEQVMRYTYHCILYPAHPHQALYQLQTRLYHGVVKLSVQTGIVIVLSNWSSHMHKATNLCRPGHTNLLYDL